MNHNQNPQNQKNLKETRNRDQKNSKATPNESQIKKRANAWRDMFSSFNKIMRYVFFFYIILLIPQIIDIIGIEKHLREQGKPLIQYWEFIFIIPGFFVSLLIFETVKKISKPFILQNWLEHKRIKETPKQRLNRVQTFFNTIVYYTLAVGINYYLIMSYSPRYMPRLLAGELNILDFFEQWGEIPEFPVRVFFMISIGHHFERTYQHIFKNVKGNNFWIMILHHIVTINLMLSCYFGRLFMYGIPVLFIHDIGDIFVGYVKVVREIKQWKHLVIPVFVVLFLIWIYTRTVIFAWEIFFPTFFFIFSERTFYFYYTHSFAIFGMAILFVLNQYWAFGMANSAFLKVFKKSGDALHFEGETVDINSEKKKH